MRRTVLSVVAVVTLVAAGVAVASSLGATKRPTVKAVQVPGLGKVLVTSSGLTLYRYTAEGRGAIGCTGACARLWPPLLVKGKAKPVAGAGINASKLGTIKRPGGGLQVTYNGYALYRYATDRKAGDVNGQGVDGKWYAIAPSGKLVRKAPTETAPPPPTETTPPPPTETTPPPPPTETEPPPPY